MNINDINNSPLKTITDIVVAVPKCRKSKFGEIFLISILELTSWHTSTLKKLYIYANQKL